MEALSQFALVLEVMQALPMYLFLMVVVVLSFHSEATEVILLFFVLGAQLELGGLVLEVMKAPPMYLFLMVVVVLYVQLEATEVILLFFVLEAQLELELLVLVVMKGRFVLLAESVDLLLGETVEVTRLYLNLFEAEHVVLVGFVDFQFVDPDFVAKAVEMAMAVFHQSSVSLVLVFPKMFRLFFCSSSIFLPFQSQPFFFFLQIRY